MSVPPDAITGLLQSLSQPQPQGGLMGSLMGGPDSALAMSLLANSNTPGKFGSILGRSMMDAQNFQNQQQLQKLNIAQQALALGRTGQQFNAINDYYNTPDQTSQGGTQAASTGVAGAQPAAQPNQPPWLTSAAGAAAAGLNPPTANGSPPAPNPFDVPQGNVYSLPVAGHTARQFAGLQFAMKGDPAEAQEATQKLQLEQAQAAMKPKIGLLDQVVDSDQPSQMVRATAPLSQLWQQAAPQYGINPNQMTDDNVRRVMSARRNQLASWAQLPTVAPPTPLQTVQTGLGGSIQIDPKTHKITTGAPQQETAQFVQPDGTLKLMTKAAGMAKGLSPYEAGTYVNPGTSSSIAQQIASYKMAPLTGQALRTTQGQDTMRQVMALNPNYDATQFTVKSQARTAFATGTQGNTVRSLSVATDHLDQLATAARELQNTGIPGANRVANFFGRQTGNPAVTNFDSMKEIVGDEVVKAVVGTSGAAGDREAIKSTFENASSPQQILGAIQKYKGLMAGQLRGLRQQYQKSTGLDDFDQMLSPNAQAQLGSGGSGAMGIGQSQTVSGFTVTRVK